MHKFVEILYFLLALSLSSWVNNNKKILSVELSDIKTIFQITTTTAAKKLLFPPCHSRKTKIGRTANGININGSFIICLLEIYINSEFKGNVT